VEATTREKVAALLAFWKPRVALLAADITNAGLRLAPLAGHPPPHTIPPIQERSPDELGGPSDAVRLRDALASVSALHRRPDIDGRLEQLLATLDTIETGSMPTEETLADLSARIREACDLLRTIVGRSGLASPGYGYVAVLLYRIVRAVEIGTGLQF
jgi:hypothetical protein